MFEYHTVNLLGYHTVLYFEVQYINIYWNIVQYYPLEYCTELWLGILYSTIYWNNAQHYLLAYSTVLSMGIMYYLLEYCTIIWIGILYSTKYKCYTSIIMYYTLNQHTLKHLVLYHDSLTFYNVMYFVYIRLIY